MRYMEIILEHGSTKNDGLNFDISQKKHVVEPSNNQEEENSSRSSNFSKKITTKLNVKIKKYVKMYWS